MAESLLEPPDSRVETKHTLPSSLGIRVLPHLAFNLSYRSPSEQLGPIPTIPTSPLSHSLRLSSSLPLKGNLHKVLLLAASTMTGQIFQLLPLSYLIIYTTLLHPTYAAIL